MSSMSTWRGCDSRFKPAHQALIINAFYLCQIIFQKTRLSRISGKVVINGLYYNLLPYILLIHNPYSTSQPYRIIIFTTSITGNAWPPRALKLAQPFLRPSRSNRGDPRFSQYFRSRLPLRTKLRCSWPHPAHSRSGLGLILL